MLTGRALTVGLLSTGLLHVFLSCGEACAQGQFVSRGETGFGYAVSLEYQPDNATTIGISPGLTLLGILDPSIALGTVWLHGPVGEDSGPEAFIYGAGIEMDFARLIPTWPDRNRPHVAGGIFFQVSHLNSDPLRIDSRLRIDTESRGYGGRALIKLEGSPELDVFPSLEILRVSTESPEKVSAPGEERIESTVYSVAMALSWSPSRKQTLFIQPRLSFVNYNESVTYSVTFGGVAGAGHSR